MSRIDVGKRVGARPLEFSEPSIDMLYDFHADTDRLGKLIARRRHVDADQVRVLPRGGNSSHQRCCGRLVDLMSSDCQPSVRHLSAISTDRVRINRTSSSRQRGPKSHSSITRAKKPQCRGWSRVRNWRTVRTGVAESLCLHGCWLAGWSAAQRRRNRRFRPSPLG